MHVCLPISNLTVVRNRDRMWLFMPTDELKKDSLRHGREDSQGGERPKDCKRPSFTPRWRAIHDDVACKIQ